MKIPSDKDELATFLRFLRDICMTSRDERNSLYQKRRRYYIFGQNSDSFVKHNRLYGHIGLVSSFLFSPDGFNYAIAAAPDADETEIQQITALQDSFNQDVQDDGIGDEIAEAVTWSLIYDTVICKQGWNDITKQQFITRINPFMFGVFDESLTDFASQPALCHMFIINYDEACERLVRAGKGSMISLLKTADGEEDTGLPNVVTQLVVAATGGSNLSGAIQGEVNPSYDPSPTFRARVTAPMVPMYELTVWDSDRNDYRTFTMLEPDIVLSDSLQVIEAIKKAGGKENKDYASDTNFFLPKEHPYTPITPFAMDQYFWGDCHEEHLITLQDWSSTRLDQINDLLDQQANPSKVFSGFMGIDDEKFGALGSGDNWVADSTPGAKVDRLYPQMPEDLFAEYAQIGNLMMEASGLTEIVAGKGTGGARGGKQAKQMQITGGGRIRRVAVGLEKPLVRIGDIGVKLKMKNDDQPIKLDNEKLPEFLPAQAPTDFTMRVSGHSHSPLFTMETEEMATLLLKSRSIDQDMFLRMLHPPQMTAMLHSLKQRQKAEALARQKQQQLEALTGKHPPKTRDRSGEE